jgi:hypothetical protein
MIQSRCERPCIPAPPLAQNLITPQPSMQNLIAGQCGGDTMEVLLISVTEGHSGDLKKGKGSARVMTSSDACSHCSQSMMPSIEAEEYFRSDRESRMTPACVTRVRKGAWRTERLRLLCRMCGAGVANIDRSLSCGMALLSQGTASVDRMCVVNASGGVNC